MTELLIDGPVATLRLTRPDSHNALTIADLSEMRRHLAYVNSHTELRVLVLTGSGKSFCSGVALAEVAGPGWTGNPLTDLCNDLAGLRVPSLCVLNGGAYGGGVELALSCDFRIGVTGMKIFVPPARIGIHYDTDGIARLARRLGPQMARRLLLGAESFDDQALLACGFLDQLVSPTELDSVVSNRVKTLAGLAPLAVEGMKITLNQLEAGQLDRAAASQRIAACWASADFAEGMAAQKEKRPPLFRRA